MPDRQARISRRAYEIWEKQGYPEGRDQENWEEAERQIDEEDLQAKREPKEVDTATVLRSRTPSGSI